MAKREPPAKTIRILCIGDSLTAGYSCLGAVYHPYEEKLVQMVEMAFPEYEVESVEDGMDGDLVSSRGNFLPRMTRRFAKKDDDGKFGPSYDWTIVLGGTNDLAWDTNSEAVFDALKKIWDIPLSHNSKVLALTIPEAGYNGKTRERIDAKRNKVNEMIKSYKRENFHVFDLHAAIPYFAMSDADRKEHWDDHIHFTESGYDLIGTKVGMALVSLLVKDKLKDQSPAKRRRNFPDDDGMFEEEGGNPNALDQGYIVVRRKDLE
ncbi:SGNH hydrolase [Coniochaeta ligniaria NRRL 30616]|uniref:SGNH hydrolase n=1 Tax=Coniochaeta ligniaria NRRL 30616 TaxID=1408157 RepID=A0A1J7J787_9PEZI|nr:SGNH hydrolase [Coniochaeta ligniaria NRRL 30616]